VTIACVPFVGSVGMTATDVLNHFRAAPWIPQGGPTAFLDLPWIQTVAPAFDGSSAVAPPFFLPCDGKVDDFDDHYFVCHTGRERILRHNNMRNLLVQILVEADVPSNVEAPYTTSALRRSTATSTVSAWTFAV